MALIDCHECGQKVSTEAAACPHCGAKPRVPAPEMAPAVVAVEKKKPSAIMRYGGGFLLVAFALAIIGTMAGGGKSEDAPKAADCAKDNLQCQGDKAVVSAGIYCKDPIERLAKHSVRWKDGTFDTKFSHFRWANKEAGVITMVGDKAEFQNGFGAYTPVIYECDLAADRKTVMDVRVREGRLPN